ncbi:hypothetical protein AB6E04_14705 [Vibrio amylolyticus]|uniref:hypothetical protein n=1 Tax=Vibrio amylolyticus TaxID=2847292 RepID=UPI00354CF278
MNKFILTALGLSLFIGSAQATTLIGVVGYESAQTVDKQATKKERQQVETLFRAVGFDFLGLNWDNTLAAKWNREGKISVARNWGYGYWDDNYGLSVDLIKGDWSGQGPQVGALGIAYKNTWDGFSLRINPTLATIDNKTTSGRITDNGAQLNVKMDYQFNDRISATFHPQYAYWNSDALGSTLKAEFNVTANLTEDKRHKLMLVHERFAANNRGTGMKTRYIGENSPIGGYVSGTESTVKLRYAYIF